MPRRNRRQRAYRGELAVAGQDLIHKYGLANESPDDLIRRKGMSYLEELEKDAHLASCLATRRQKLIKKGWRIKPVEKNGKVTARAREMAEFTKHSIDCMQGAFEKDLEAMLDATSKGFSLSEINYQLLQTGRFTGKLGLKNIRFKPARYFSFKYDKLGYYEIRQIDPNPNGTPLPREKFIHLIAGNNDENPYGDGVTSKCAFWVWLKKNQAKFWAIFNERFGLPLTRVKMPRNPSKADETAADSIIRMIQSRAGIRVPENFEIDFLEAARRGDITYDNFIERCNKEISKVVLGSTLTSEEGKRGQGSYALGSTHAETVEDYIIFDAAMLESAINEQLIQRLIDHNYITDDYPRFEWLGIDIGTLISLAQSLGIFVDRGLEVPVSWIYERTGIPLPREGEPVLAAAAVQDVHGSTPPVSNQPDNRSPRQFSEQFAELPEHIQEEISALDELHQRYVKLAGDRYEDLLKKLSVDLKKKLD